MDGCSGKRAVDGLLVSRKGSGLVLRDTVNSRDRNAQFCNRIGCGARLNPMKSAQIGSSDKSKPARPSFRASSSGKEIVGSSSRTGSAVKNARKTSENTKKILSSSLETDSSETSSVQDEPEVSLYGVPPGKLQKGLHPEDVVSREVTRVKAGSSSATSSTRTRRNFHQRSGLGNQDSLVGSSLSLSSRSTSQAARADANRYGLKNLRCNSITDVTPSGHSSSNASPSRRKDVVKKRNSDGESSSSNRGKKIIGPSVGRSYNSGHGICISDTRQARNWPSDRNSGASSVRTRRPMNNYNRTRHSNQGNGNTLSLNESPAVISQASQTEIPIDPDAPIPEELSPDILSSYSRPRSSSEHFRGIMSGPSEVDIMHSLTNRNSFRRYNMDGIAEVLLTLERIEQDEELTYEQLLVLETNLFLNGLNVYDQHRDMRLDIDNMSYEELLALEERMGTVSTALSEEALSKCLKTSIYQLAPLDDAIAGCCGDICDVKCSICQEEYVVGDEVGRLHCEHRYHIACINQWLRLKNWCPICKAAAEPSSS